MWLRVLRFWPPKEIKWKGLSVILVDSEISFCAWVICLSWPGAMQFLFALGTNWCDMKENLVWWSAPSSQLCRTSSVCVQAKPLRWLRFAFVRAVIIELRPILLTLLSATVLHHRILLYDKEVKGAEPRSSIPYISSLSFIGFALSFGPISSTVFFANSCFTRVNTFSTYFIWSRRGMNVFSDILSLPRASTLHLPL